MASAVTLAEAVVRIGTDARLLRTGLQSVRGQLLAFVPLAHAMGGRIGGALVGGLALASSPLHDRVGPFVNKRLGLGSQVEQANADVKLNEEQVAAAKKSARDEVARRREDVRAAREVLEAARQKAAIDNAQHRQAVKDASLDHRKNRESLSTARERLAFAKKQLGTADAELKKTGAWRKSIVTNPAVAQANQHLMPGPIRKLANQYWQALQERDVRHKELSSAKQQAGGSAAALDAARAARDATAASGQSNVRSAANAVKAALKTVADATKTGKAGIDAAEVSLTAARATAAAAAAAFAEVAAGFTAMAATGAGAVVVILALASGMVALTVAAEPLRIALHNVNETFGSHAKVVEDAAQRSYKAFGTSKAAFMAYAEYVGRDLQRQGVAFELSAELAAKAAEAARRYASSRGISFEQGQAEFERLRHAGADEVSGYMKQHQERFEGLSATEMHHPAVQEYVRLQLALEAVKKETSDNQEAQSNWTDSTARLAGQFTELGNAMGKVFGPVVVLAIDTLATALEAINTVVGALANSLAVAFGWLQKIGNTFLHPFGKSKDKNEDTDKKAQGRTEEHKVRKAYEMVMKTPHRGSLEGLHQKIQEMAWQGAMLDHQVKSVELLGKIEKNTERANNDKGVRDKEKPGIPMNLPA